VADEMSLTCDFELSIKHIMRYSIQLRRKVKHRFSTVVQYDM
jgi:hypothetical protein